MFQNIDDRIQLERVFRAYLTEWGAENIVVTVPDRWKERFGISQLGKVRVGFHTRNSVSIHAELDNTPCARFEMAIVAVVR